MSNTVTDEDIKALNSRERKFAEDRMKEYAKTQCKVEGKALRDCTHNRFISVAWVCKDLFKDLNECFHKHTTDAERRRFQEEYILEKRSRQQNQEK